jgi:hypothetical protein
LGRLNKITRVELRAKDIRESEVLLGTHWELWDMLGTHCEHIRNNKNPLPTSALLPWAKPPKKHCNSQKISKPH